MRESALAFSQHMRPKKTALYFDDRLIVLNAAIANESFNESECAALLCLRAVPARSCLVTSLGLRATRALRSISANALPACARFCAFSAVQPPAQVLDANLYEGGLSESSRVVLLCWKTRAHSCGAHAQRSYGMTELSVPDMPALRFQTHEDAAGIPVRPRVSRPPPTGPPGRLAAPRPFATLCAGSRFGRTVRS
jgi:hypothetical protein